MTPTIWQKAWLNVNDVTAFPREFLAPCADAGYAGVQVLLNPHHPDTSLDQVPLSYIRAIRDLGMKAWGFVWADDFASPLDCAEFCIAWRKKSLDNGCALTGFVINAEDGVEARDQAGDGWSKNFLAVFRAHPLTAKVSLALNTYNGAGGIALPEWQARSARLYCQTFHEGNTHEWPISSYKPWSAMYGYTKWSQVKPNWATYKGVDGKLPNRAAQIADAKAAGTVGFAAWYAEAAGEPRDVLIPLLNEARAAGVCY